MNIWFVDFPLARKQHEMNSETLQESIQNYWEVGGVVEVGFAGTVPPTFKATEAGKHSLRSSKRGTRQYALGGIKHRGILS